jgi:hypothetical protein
VGWGECKAGSEWGAMCGKLGSTMPQLTCVPSGDDVGMVVAQHIQQRKIGLAHFPAGRAGRKTGWTKREQWEGARAHAT